MQCACVDEKPESGWLDKKKFKNLYVDYPFLILSILQSVMKLSRHKGAYFVCFYFLTLP